jgi:hypothetical protein
VTGFEEAFIGLADAVEGFAGFPVTLTRVSAAGPVSCEAVAVLGRTVFSRSRKGEGGPSVEYGDGDFIIRKTAYLLGDQGEAVEPADGDRIFDQATGRLFEVRPIVGEESKRPSEPECITWRIHTTEIQQDG